MAESFELTYTRDCPRAVASATRMAVEVAAAQARSNLSPNVRSRLSERIQADVVLATPFPAPNEPPGQRVAAIRHRTTEAVRSVLQPATQETELFEQTLETTVVSLLNARDELCSQRGALPDVRPALGTAADRGQSRRPSLTDFFAESPSLDIKSIIPFYDFCRRLEGHVAGCGIAYNPSFAIFDLKRLTVTLTYASELATTCVNWLNAFVWPRVQQECVFILKSNRRGADLCTCSRAQLLSERASEDLGRRVLLSRADIFEITPSTLLSQRPVPALRLSDRFLTLLGTERQSILSGMGTQRGNDFLRGSDSLLGRGLFLADVLFNTESYLSNNEVPGPYFVTDGTYVHWQVIHVGQLASNGPVEAQEVLEATNGEVRATFARVVANRQSSFWRETAMATTTTPFHFERREGRCRGRPIAIKQRVQVSLDTASCLDRLSRAQGVCRLTTWARLARAKTRDGFPLSMRRLKVDNAALVGDFVTGGLEHLSHRCQSLSSSSQAHC